MANNDRDRAELTERHITVAWTNCDVTLEDQKEIVSVVMLVPPELTFDLGPP